MVSTTSQVMLFMLMIKALCRFVAKAKKAGKDDQSFINYKKHGKNPNIFGKVSKC